MVAAPKDLEHAAAISATPLGAITIHKWARRSGRSPEFTIWKDDVDFYCKMMNVDNIETYLNLEEPHLADDGATPVSAARRREHGSQPTGRDWAC